MRRTRCGFTVVELLVVISIIGLLIGILLPAVGKARDNARVAVSRSNAREISIALHTYASDWKDRQWQCAVDTLGAYGSVAEYNRRAFPVNDPDVPDSLEVHPGIGWGWGDDGRFYGYWMRDERVQWLVQPICFDGFPSAFSASPRSRRSTPTSAAAATGRCSTRPRTA